MNFNDGSKHFGTAGSDPDVSALADIELVLGSAAPALRTAFEAAAIPHWFDGRILGSLVQVDERTIKGVLQELCRLPLVELFAIRDAWHVRESARLAFRAHLARKEPDRFRVLSTQAAACFPGDEPELVIERLFHELVAEPDSAPGELYRVWTAWTRAGKDRCLQALGAMVQELLKLPELDPLSRGFASVCLGWIMQGRQSQGKIEDLAREALTLFRQVNELKGEAEACSLLGQALQKRGSLPEALCEYESAKRIMLQLTRREPENDHLQRDLSVAHTYIGGVFQAQGQLGDALREYQAYQQIMLRLVQREPENTDWLRKLSIARIRVGGVLQGQGHLDDALCEYETAKRIMLDLTQRDPQNAHWQRDLSAAHNCVGGVFQAQARLGDALREYQAYKQIMLRLTEIEPENTYWQRDLSIAHNRVGGVLQAQGRLGDALCEYEAHKEIMLRLVRRDPENAHWQQDLSIAHNRIGGVLQAEGRLGDALCEYEA